MARILVTGVRGQVGSYLAELLLAEGHTVLGAPRGGSFRPMPPGVVAARGSLDANGLATLATKNGDLDAVVHLAAQTSIVASERDPLTTFDANARTTAALAFQFEATATRFVHTSSGQIFGNPCSDTQDEATPLAPNSPYALSKACAHMTVTYAREARGAAMSNLICYQGVSPRREGGGLVRTLTRGVADVATGRARHVTLGNLSCVRDFSHAIDFARAAKLLALAAPAGDYICASGVGRTVRELAQAACDVVGLNAERVVREDRSIARPPDACSLVGDSRRLRAVGWTPAVTFNELVRELVEHEMARVRRGTRDET